MLAGDHLYRMDYAALVESHKANHADITIAAQPVDAETATQMGIFRFDGDGTIVAFEEKPDAERLAQIGLSNRRYLPPIGTAGLERNAVSGKSRAPWPPPRMIARVSFIMAGLSPKRSMTDFTRLDPPRGAPTVNAGRMRAGSRR